MYPVGVLKLFDIELAPDVANTNVIWRPPEGIEWIHMHELAQHNNVANTAVYWDYYEPDTGKSIYICGSTVATNSNVFCERTSARSWEIPLKSTHDIYIRARFTPEAGKRLVIQGAYIERPENYDLLVQELLGSAVGYRLPIKSRE